MEGYQASYLVFTYLTLFVLTLQVMKAKVPRMFAQLAGVGRAGEQQHWNSKAAQPGSESMLSWGRGLDVFVSTSLAFSGIPESPLAPGIRGCVLEAERLEFEDHFFICKVEIVLQRIK